MTLPQNVQKGLSGQHMREGLLSSQDYTVKVLDIVCSDGTFINIRLLAVEINLFEDIFSPYMSGNILVGEAVDLMALYKFNGTEFIIMELDKPGLNMPIKKVFRIYKISNRKIGVTLQNYIIHFCSEEAILSIQKLVSKSYKGMLVSDMIKDLLENKLKTNKSKIATIEKTSGVFNYIIPRMNPFEAIEWLSSRAYSSNGKLYLFYENRNGYNFISYETLINAPTYQKYYQRPKVNVNPVQNINSVTFLQIDQDFDIIESSRYGAYASTLAVYDFVSHQMKVYSSNYSDYKLLNSSIPINDFKNRFNETVLEATDAYFKFVPTIDADTTVNPQKQQHWVNKKAMKLAQLNTFRMVVSIPGDVLMQVGNVIEVELPKALPQGKKTEVNVLRTGRYLVTSVHHVFFNDVMSTVMELMSDSVSGLLPAAVNNTPGIKELRSL